MQTYKDLFKACFDNVNLQQYSAKNIFRSTILTKNITLFNSPAMTALLEYSVSLASIIWLFFMIVVFVNIIRLTLLFGWIFPYILSQ